MADSLQIRRGTASRDGSCNFCDQLGGGTIVIVSGRGQGPQLQVRFCLSCLSELKKERVR